MFLEVDRKQGSSEAINIRVELKTPTDISELPITFYLWSTNRARTQRIATTERVTATDISADNVNASGQPDPLPAFTAWKLTYQPTPGELAWEGVHLAEFEVDYGNNQKIPYPYGRSFIRVTIREHQGIPAA